MSDSDATSGQSSSEKLFSGLAEALGVLAQRLTGQEDAARDIADMAFRAEQIAARAKSINTGGSRNGLGIMQELAAELGAFAIDMVAHAARATQESALSQKIAAALLRHTKLMTEHSSSTADPAVLRTHLNGLLEVLVAVPGQLAANTALARQMAALAERATQLVVTAHEAVKQRNSLSRSAADLHRELSSVANDAATASAQMLSEATAIRATADTLAKRTARLTQTPAQRAAAQAAALETKVHSVIDQGKTIAAQRTKVGMAW